MKLREIYELFVKLGIENDPRGKERIENLLKKENEKFKKLDKKDLDYYEKARLANPFADTRILFGDENTEVKKVLVGIDMEIGEILLADRLNEKGEKVDLVLSHHPEGIAYANLDEVMHLQADVLCNYGVPINVAEGLLAGRIKEVSRGVAPANHQRPVDAARILNIPFMSSHTVADNMVYKYVKDLMDNKQPDTVGEVLDLLLEIPEYREGKKLGAGPRLFAGSPDNRAGKIAVTEMTGGTSGSKEMFEKMSHAGIGTIIGMHMGEEHRKEAEKHHINVVIAGHMASDSLGMNLLLDEIEKKGVEILPVSGLIRIKR
jgi:putative NIF3 family GTP cyclohydrolase 1 type 2